MFFSVVHRLVDYFRGVFPSLYEQVSRNLWIGILQNFFLGNILTMFLVSITIIFFELPHVTLNVAAGIAAAGGEY